MHINQANIYNLTELWKKYGASTTNEQAESISNNIAQVYMTDCWPHRCWHEDETPTNDFAWLTQSPDSAILPVWPIFDKNTHAPITTRQNPLETHLLNHNWQCQLEQTAMFLSLIKDNPVTQSNQPKVNFDVKIIHNNEEMAVWIDIASKAFGYVIDTSVIEKVKHDQDIQFLLAYDNGQPVATGLLYKTGDIIGVHQVGVPPQFQGKGIARLLMQKLIELCQKQQATYIVLQASQSGKALYDKLGFTEQFVIRSYKKEMK